MPVYEYIAEKDGCSYCKEGFDVIRPMSAEPLTECPKCGASVRKKVSPVSVHRNVLSPSNLKDKGFAKLVKKDKGVYERET